MLGLLESMRWMLCNQRQCKLSSANVLNSSTNIGLVYNGRLLDYAEIIIPSYSSAIGIMRTFKP